MLCTARPPLTRSRLTCRGSCVLPGWPGHAGEREGSRTRSRARSRVAAAGVPLLRRGEVAVAVFACGVRLLRQVYPGRQVLRRVPGDARLVVCEPIGDLPAAWNGCPRQAAG
jgi:hypothetical protein